MKNDILKRFGRFVKRNSGILLAIPTTAGVIGTGVLAAKGGQKDIHIDRKNVKERVKCYIPSAICGVLTVGCVVTSAVLNKKQQTALISACAFIGKQYRDYRKKNIELNGPEHDKQIFKEIAAEKAKKVDIEYGGIVESFSLSNGISDEPVRLFYDIMTERYFYSTLSAVVEAEYAINRVYTISGRVSIDTYCKFLGLESGPEWDILGWDVGCGLAWVDFEHEVVTLEDGLECVLIMAPFAAEYLDIYE